MSISVYIILHCNVNSLILLSVFFSELFGRHIGMLAKNRSKITAALKARHMCDVCNAHIAVYDEQLLCFLNSCFSDIFKWAHTCVLSENTA